MSPSQSSTPYWDVVFLYSLILLASIPTALSQLAVPLTFYTDNSCANPSTEHPTYSANLNECIVTTGLGSVSLQTIPCTTGDVQVLGYADTACGTSLFMNDHFSTCFGASSGDIAAVLVTCNQPNELDDINATPTATTTVAVGPVAGSASTNVVLNGDTETTTLSTPSGFTTMTSSGSQPTSANPLNTSPTSISSSSPYGLDTSDIIALAVGLGVGIPPIIIGLLALRNKRVTGSYLHGWGQTSNSWQTNTWQPYPGA